MFASKKRERILRTVTSYTMLLLMFVIFILPFAWLVSSAFKPANQMYRMPPQWIPDPIILDNFKEGWAVLPFGLYLQNTVMVSVIGVIGTVVSSALVAYGFARFRSRFNGFLFTLLISTMMLPLQVTLLPTYQLFSQFKWINTYKPILVPQFFAVNAFYVFLLRQFFRTVPMDLDEAARIDGCNTFHVFLSIMLPLCRPALITVAVFSFINNWNDFMTQLIYLNSEKKYTIAIGMQFFSSKYGPQSINLLMAVSLLTLIPLLAVFFVAQKYFVEGITTSGIKG